MLAAESSTENEAKEDEVWSRGREVVRDEWGRKRGREDMRVVTKQEV